MMLFPIVERELRVASRRAMTFWLRLISAIVAVIIAWGVFVIIESVPGGIGVQAGKPLFVMLTWMAFVATLCAGMFFTADCLSEEKRDGTLGFLFLTDLRGYDVVFGKLIGTLCRCTFALIAIFPVLGCTLLMGGVDPGEFWRTILCLVHTLFFSLAAGMLISSLSKHALKALAATIVLILLFSGGTLLLDSGWAEFNRTTFKPFFSFASPAFLFWNAGNWSPYFRTAFAVNQIVAWLMLAATCLLIPWTWQEKSKRGRGETWTFINRLRFGSERRRARVREKTMDPNPTTWLVCRERMQSLIMWGIALLVVGWCLLAAWMEETSMFEIVGWRVVNWVATAVMCLWVTSQASQFFADARRSWLLDLMLTTPMEARTIAPGAWRGLLRMFGLPVLIVLAVSFLSQVFSMDGSGWMFTGGDHGPIAKWIFVIGSACCVLIKSLANFLALAWFAMWMGLISRNGLLGTLKTILLVQVVPWMLIMFATAMMFPLMALLGASNWTSKFSADWFRWMPIVTVLISTALNVGKDIVIYVIARDKMVNHLRDIVVRQIAPPTIYLPRIAPRVAPPPVIQSSP
jgi:ABC-type transport system involved in multi-copper enzyme maturation permease subunit